jgi:hypothetical protein
MTVPTFEEYLASLSPVSTFPVGGVPADLELCERATEAVSSMDPLDASKLATAISNEPDLLPVLAAVAGLSQERFKGWLKANFDTAGWITLGRQRALDVVRAMQDQFDILDLLREQSARDWTWADVLAQVMSPRGRAGSAIQQGRDLEDQVEAAIDAVSLPFVARTRFLGTNASTAPADFAIPGSEGKASIAVAVKGFDSTGSKLSDARREIEEMATIRKPGQYIFAVIDGHGWARRQGDLRRIHELWEKDRIEGLFNQKSLVEFQAALQDAGRRLRLID